MKISRIKKMIRRKLNNKSLLDFNAVMKACDLGYMIMTGSSDNIDIKITEKGLKLIEE